MNKELLFFILGAFVSIVVSFIFFRLQNKRRKLVYSINPVRTAVVQSGQTTDLAVSYRGEPLGNQDVTAVQIAIWNSGNEVIEQKDIRKNIKVITQETRILEASFKKWHPNTVFSIDNSVESFAEGKIGISWTILEPKEGVTVQLLYMGKPTVNIEMVGQITGQGRIKQIDTNPSFRSPKEQHKKKRDVIVWLSISFMISIVLLLITYVFQIRDTSGLISVFTIITVASLVFASFALISTFNEKYPPGGF